MTEPNYSVGFSALTLGTSGSIAVGDALVFNAATGYWLRATSDNRTAADSRAQAIALTAYGGSAIGTVSYQAAGILATSISGLAATTPGLYQLVRVSTAGRLERVASYTDGDDIVGYAYPDGRVALHIGIPWSLIAGTFAGASLPDFSVQYRKPDGTLGGAAFASVSTDGYPQYGSLPALTGAARYSSSSQIKVRNATNTSDLIAWRHRGALSNCADYLFFGDRAQGLAVVADRLNEMAAGWDGVSGWYSGLIIFSDDAYSAGSTVRGVQIYDNLSLDIRNGYGGTGDPKFGSGRGIFSFRKVTTTPTGNPVDRFWSWVETDGANANKWNVKMPNGITIDLINDTQQTVDITSGAASVNLANGRILKLTGTTTLTAVITLTPQPTTSALCTRFAVRNLARATGGIQLTNALGGATSPTTNGADDWFGSWVTTPDGISGSLRTTGGTEQVFVA